MASGISQGFTSEDLSTLVGTTTNRVRRPTSWGWGPPMTKEKRKKRVIKHERST